MTKEEKEDIRFTAECLQYVLLSINKYPPKDLRLIAEGKGDITKKKGGEIRLQVITLYFTLDPEKWNKLADPETPKGRKLIEWISSNFIQNPGSDSEKVKE